MCTKLLLGEAFDGAYLIVLFLENPIIVLPDLYVLVNFLLL